MLSQNNVERFQGGNLHSSRLSNGVDRRAYNATEVTRWFLATHIQLHNTFIMATIRHFCWAIGALQALASPFPQSSQTSSECSLDPNDPASWAQSGAAQYMEAWFNTNGTEKWLQAMDESTTTIEGFSSTLDCRPLGGNTCPAPITPCLQFTPPELRLVRVASTNAHDLFSRIHEKLQDKAIENVLSVDQIMLDFGPKAAEEGFNYVNAIASGFFVASPIASLASAAGPAGPILGASKNRTLIRSWLTMIYRTYRRPLRSRQCIEHTRAHNRSSNSQRNGVQTTQGNILKHCRCSLAFQFEALRWQRRL